MPTTPQAFTPTQNAIYLDVRASGGQANLGDTPADEYFGKRLKLRRDSVQKAFDALVARGFLVLGHSSGGGAAIFFSEVGHHPRSAKAAEPIQLSAADRAQARYENEQTRLAAQMVERTESLNRLRDTAIASKRAKEQLERALWKSARTPKRFRDLLMQQGMGEAAINEALNRVQARTEATSSH